MQLNIDPQTLTAAGVGVGLLASLFRALFHTPKQKAQINAVEAKLDVILNQVATVLPSQVATVLPSQIATVLPSQIATVLPSQIATVLPSQIATVLPSQIANSVAQTFPKVGS